MPGGGSSLIEADDIPACSRITAKVGLVMPALRSFAPADRDVTFHYKDYRGGGRFKRKIMTIAPFEFIRRFLIHILPDRFHRIRHYGLFANGQRAANLHRIRALLNAAPPSQPDKPVQDHDDPRILRFPCPACGGRMIIIDSFEPGTEPPDYKTDTERINAA